MVKVSVDPINTTVGKEQEKGELDDIVPQSGSLLCCVVEFTKASNFKEKKWCRTDRHERHGFVGLFDLEPNLILDKFWVVEGTFVKD
jgi:hypothetical protein